MLFIYCVICFAVKSGVATHMVSNTWLSNLDISLFGNAHNHAINPQSDRVALAHQCFACDENRGVAGLHRMLNSPNHLEFFGETIFVDASRNEIREVHSNDKSRLDPDWSMFAEV